MLGLIKTLVSDLGTFLVIAIMVLLALTATALVFLIR